MASEKNRTDVLTSDQSTAPRKSTEREQYIPIMPRAFKHEA